MNRKIAAALLAVTMLSTPAFAASVASSPNASASQTVTPDKVTKASEKSVKKHRIHARKSHGHKIHYAKHAKPGQVKHATKAPKKSLTSTSTKGDSNAVAAAQGKASVKN